MIDSKRLRSADSRASGGGPRVLHLFAAFPSHTEHLEGRSSSGEVRTLACRAVAHRAYCASVHSESKTRRVARASLWSARCSSLLRSAAPSPHHTHAHPAAASAIPPLRRTRRALAHTLSHTSLSRRLSIAPLLPFVAPPLRRLCRAKLPPCRSLMMRRRSLSPTSASRAAHTLRRSLHLSSLAAAAAAAAAAASETYNARRPPRAAPHVPPRPP